MGAFGAVRVERDDLHAGAGHGLLRTRKPLVSQGANRGLRLEQAKRARARLEWIAARNTRPPKKEKARSLAPLRADWKQSAILTSRVAAPVINSLLEHARAATAAIRARVAAVVDVALVAVDVAATVFVMNEGGRFHRRHFSELRGALSRSCWQLCKALLMPCSAY